MALPKSLTTAEIANPRILHYILLYINIFAKLNEQTTYKNTSIELRIKVQLTILPFKNPFGKKCSLFCFYCLFFLIVKSMNCQHRMKIEALELF